MAHINNDRLQSISVILVYRDNMFLSSLSPNGKCISSKESLSKHVVSVIPIRLRFSKLTKFHKSEILGLFPNEAPSIEKEFFKLCKLIVTYA